MLPISGDASMHDRSLTSRAVYSFLAKFARMLVKFIVTLVITPILISGLGVEVFGIWSMIQKLSAYVSLADFRASGAAKLLLSVRQHDADETAKRRIVGSTLIIWLLFLPLVVSLSILLIVNVENFLPVHEDQITAVRWALGIFLFGVVTSRVSALPNNILQATNLGYRAFVAEIVVPIITATCLVFALNAGLGLPGIAAVTVGGLFLDGLLRFFVVKKNVPWFGVAKPNRQDIRGFLGIAGWMQVTNLANLLLWGIDILIVGKLLGGSTAAVLVQTAFLHRLVVEAVGMFFMSGKAGLVGLIGEGKWNRVQILREEIQILALGLMTVSGIVFMLLNDSFVLVWVGEGLYAGPVTNVCLIAGSILTVLSRNEAMLLDGLLEVRAKAGAMISAGVITVALGLIMTERWGISGMMAAWVFGQSILYISLLTIVWKTTGKNCLILPWQILRPLVVVVALLFLTYNVKDIVVPDTWPSLIAALVSTGFGACVISWLLVFDGRTRAALLVRIRLLLTRGNNQ